MLPWTYQHLPQQGSVRSLAGTVSSDRYGLGLAADTQFENRVMHGDAFVRVPRSMARSAPAAELDSTVALGGSRLALSGQYLPYEAGLIVDVETDIDDLELRADDFAGSSSVLRPGRNDKVSAYKSGHVQLDFQSAHDPAAVIQPPTLAYHLNRGGVEHRTLRVMRTVTVLIGRLLDTQGKPLKGAMLINHAGRSVSEADGFFVVDISESIPTLDVMHQGQRPCFLRLSMDALREEGDGRRRPDLRQQQSGSG